MPQFFWIFILYHSILSCWFNYIVASPDFFLTILLSAANRSLCIIESQSRCKLSLFYCFEWSQIQHRTCMPGLLRLLLCAVTIPSLKVCKHLFVNIVMWLFRFYPSNIFRCFSSLSSFEFRVRPISFVCMQPCLWVIFVEVWQIKRYDPVFSDAWYRLSVSQLIFKLLKQRILLILYLLPL